MFKYILYKLHGLNTILIYVLPSSFTSVHMFKLICVAIRNYISFSSRMCVLSGGVEAVAVRDTENDGATGIGKRYRHMRAKTTDSATASTADKNASPFKRIRSDGDVSKIPSTSSSEKKRIDHSKELKALTR